MKAKSRAHLAPANAGDAQHAAIEILDDPLPLQRDFQKRGAERAADVRPSLTPINTGIGEATAQSSGRRDVDPESPEFLHSTFAEVVRLIARSQPAELLEAIMKRDSDRTRHVIVASAGRPQTRRSVRRKSLPRSAGNDHQCLDCRGDAATFQAVVAMFSLSVHVHQPLLLQPREMDAGCRWTHLGDNRELCARPGITVHQATEHPRACRFGDRRGNSGERGVSIHTLIINEACLFANIDTSAGRTP